MNSGAEVPVSIIHVFTSVLQAIKTMYITEAVNANTEVCIVNRLNPCI